MTVFAMSSTAVSRFLAAAGLILLFAGCSDGGECVSANPLMPTCITLGADEPRLVFTGTIEDPLNEELWDVYTMTSRGTSVRRLTTSGLADFPRWSPDGRQIAYLEFAPDFPASSLMVMDADGSNQRNVSNNVEGIHGNPAWSPDGRRLAFHSNRHNPQDFSARSIYVVDVDGSNVVRLTTNEDWIDREPHWSPDGSRIVFTSNRSGAMQIFVMNADGTDQRQLTTIGINQFPNWSPDGTKISFSSRRTSDGVPDNGIYVMNADGTGQTNLTRGKTMWDMFSTWSADGREIYFCSMRSGMHIWKVGVTDGVVRPVTNPGNMSMEAQPNAKWPRPQ